MRVSFEENATVGALIEVLLKLPLDMRVVIAEGAPTKNCAPGRFQNRCSPLHTTIVGKTELHHCDRNFSVILDPDQQPADSVCIFPCD